MGRFYKGIKPMFEKGKWRIFPGDLVFINHGPHKRETGKVLQVIKDKRVPQVIVEGVNLRKKKVYTGKSEDDFFVVTLEAPIHYSQVSLMEPAPAVNSQDSEDSPKKPEQRWVRAKFRYLADGTRVRIGAHSKNATGAVIPIPTAQTDEGQKLGVGGPKDAVSSEVVRSTYQPEQDDFNQWINSQRPTRVMLSSGSGGASNVTADGARSYTTWLQAACARHAYSHGLHESSTSQYGTGRGGVAGPSMSINRLAGGMALQGWLRQALRIESFT